MRLRKSVKKFITRENKIEIWKLEMSEENKALVGEIMGEARQDSVLALISKYKFLIIGVCVAVVASVAGFEIYKSQQRNEQIAQTEIVQSLLNQEGGEVSANALNSDLAKLVYAQNALQAGDHDKAIPLLDDIIATADMKVNGELARLLKFSIVADEEDLALENSAFQAEYMVLRAQKLFAADKGDEAMALIKQLFDTGLAGNLTEKLELLVLANGRRIDEFAPAEEG